VTSIDEAAGAVGGNAEEARNLAGSITASKQILDDLTTAMAALGLDKKSGQASSMSTEAETLTAQALGLANALGELQTRIDSLRTLLAAASTGGSPGTSRPSEKESIPAQGTKNAGPDSPATSGPSSTVSSTATPSATSPSATSNPRTEPSHAPDLSRRPVNEPDPTSKPGKHGDIQSENEAAVVLARAGYEIEQNPPPKPNGKEPDYFIEGDYWDCYTVRTDNPERVRKSIKDKANPKSGNVQADRIILNFDGARTGVQTSVTPEVVEALLQRKPIHGLKEVKVIKDGHVRDLDLKG
jgi:hypothetical protein